MRLRQAHCILFSMNLSRRLFVMLGATVPPLLRSQNSPAGRATADEALKALMAGNERFLKGETIIPRRSPADFSSMALHQAPKAIVIACADSRVPPEILFDQGVGDLFVIRVAGNIVNRAEAGVVGSMAFAVLVLGAPLIMVLGHSNCGAVEAAISGKKDSLPASLRLGRHGPNGLAEGFGASDRRQRESGRGQGEGDRTSLPPPDPERSAKDYGRCLRSGVGACFSQASISRPSSARLPPEMDYQQYCANSNQNLSSQQQPGMTSGSLRPAQKAARRLWTRGRSLSGCLAPFHYCAGCQRVI